MSNLESKEQAKNEGELEFIKKISKEEVKKTSEEKEIEEEDVEIPNKGFYNRLKAIDIPFNHGKTHDTEKNERNLERRVTFCGAFHEQEEELHNTSKKRGSILKTSNSLK